jgi:hypothetical protein
MYFGRPVCLPCPAAALPVARNVFRASSMPALPRCRLVSRPKCISGVQYACPAPLPPGQLPEIHFGRPVCLLRSAAAWSVARNSFRVPGVPALPRCRLVSRPKFISGVQCACSAPLPPGQLPEIHFGRPVCLHRPAAAWSVARNSLRASSVPAPPRCVSRPKFIAGVQYACPAPLPPGQLPEMYFGRLVCLPRPATAWSVARNSFRASSVPAPPRCVSRPKFISGVQCACPAPLRQSPEIHFGRPVCLPCPAAALPVARNVFRASSMPALPRCRPAGCPKCISGVQYACPAPLPPGQLPEIHFGRPVCLLRSAAAWSVARNSFRASSVPALPPCRLVCLPRPAAAWSVARNSFRASSMPALPRCRLVSRPKFISGVQCACPAPLPPGVPAPPRCRLVSCPKFISGVQYACPAPLPPGQSPEIHFGRPVCLPRPAASVARNSLRASSMPAPPRCVSRPKFISGVQCACPARLPPGQLPEIHFGRPVCLPRPAASVARNSFRASSVPAPPRCVSRPKFIAGVQYACPAPLRQSPEIHCGRPVCLPRPPAGCPKFIAGVQCACPAPLRQSPEIHCGRPVCLPRPAASVARNSLRASSVPAPPRCRLVSYPKCISGAWCACPAPLPPGQLPEIHFGRPVCLPRPATAWSVTRNVFRAPGVPAPPRCRLVSYPKCISGVWCACPAPLSQRTIFTPPVPAAI